MYILYTYRLLIITEEVVVWKSKVQENDRACLF